MTDSAPHEPPEARLAEKAWARKEYELGRELYRRCVEAASDTGTSLSPSVYLSEWARMEGSIGNRQRFDELHREAIAREPDAPLLRLSYARDTWTEFKDGAACLAQLVELENLLESDRWNRAQDLSPLAYEQKIGTLKAWVRGEPGGTLWP